MWVCTPPPPPPAQGYLCLSPSGPLGWRLGGLFTFNLAMKLTCRAWERDECFQLGGSPGCQPLAKVLKCGADTICPQMERQPSLVPPVILPITPIYNHTAYPHRIHGSDPKARGQTATPRDMRLHRHPAPNHRAQHAHCHSKTTGLSGHQAHRFHFISATPLQTQRQYFQPSNLEPPASSLNLGDLEVPGSTAGKTSIRRSCLSAGFISPDQHRKPLDSFEPKGFPKRTCYPFPFRYFPSHPFPSLPFPSSSEKIYLLCFLTD